jgi:hypothetical protein
MCLAFCAQGNTKRMGDNGKKRPYNFEKQSYLYDLDNFELLSIYIKQLKINL